MGATLGSGAFATGISLPTSAGQDVWAARYTAIGTIVWARRYGGPGTDANLGSDSRAGARCEALSDGSYLLAAISDGDFDMAGTMLPGSAPSLVVGRIADDGTPLWARRTDGGGTLSGTTLVDLVANADESEASVALRYDSTTGFDTSFDANGGSVDMYLARLTL